MPIVISIDGNIGSGKSTIVKKLKDQFINEEYIIFLEEPVNEWIKIKDDKKNIIEKFYEDPDKYSFPFQMMALISRFKILNDTMTKYPNSIIITERSLYTDKHIFAKMLFDSNKINTFEYQIYNKWFDEFVKKLPEHKFIYLHTKPDTCIKRIKTRARDGEDKIDIEYLNKCNEYHDDMFQKIKYELKVNLDNCDLESSNYNKIINEIRTYILCQNSNSNHNTNYNLIIQFIILFICVIIYNILNK